MNDNSHVFLQSYSVIHIVMFKQFLIKVIIIVKFAIIIVL